MMDVMGQTHVSRYTGVVLIIVAGYCAASTAAAAVLYMGTPNVTLHVPVVSEQEERFQTTVRQERDYSCGSAAVATLLTYHYETPVSEHDVFAVMYREGDQKQIMRDGFSLLDMKHYLDGRGFHAEGYRMPLDEFAKIGIPAITLINDDGYNHFVVIKGISKRHVLLGDPAKGTRAISRRRFEKMWNGLVFVLRDENAIATAHFNRSEEWRQADIAPLETVIPRQGVAGLLLSLPGPHEF
jgi:predicted double-glycine peptidase